MQRCAATTRRGADRRRRAAVRPQDHRRAKPDRRRPALLHPRPEGLRLRAHGDAHRAGVPWHSDDAVLTSRRRAVRPYPRACNWHRSQTRVERNNSEEAPSIRRTKVHLAPRAHTAKCRPLPSDPPTRSCSALARSRPIRHYALVRRRRVFTFLATLIACTACGSSARTTTAGEGSISTATEAVGPPAGSVQAAARAWAHAYLTGTPYEVAKLQGPDCTGSANDNWVEYERIAGEWKVADCHGPFGGSSSTGTITVPESIPVSTP